MRSGVRSNICWLFLLSLIFVAGCGGGGESSSNISNNGNEVLASATIGSEGGKVTTSDGKVVIDIPAGALSQDTNITISSTRDQGVIGDVYALGPAGTTFAQPVEVTILYAHSSLPSNVTEDSLYLVTETEDGYLEPLTDIILDEPNNKVTGKMLHFSSVWITYSPLVVNGNNQPILSNDIPFATSFRMPIGDPRDMSSKKIVCNDGLSQFSDDLGNDVTLLSIATYSNAYPKIEFNANGDSNKWIVGTAFKQNQSLTNYDSGTVEQYSSNGDFHPGDDWNDRRGGASDNGMPIHASADGIVLYNQKQWKADSSRTDKTYNFGNILVIGHKLNDGSIIASVYAHMKDSSPCSVGVKITKGDIIGLIGDTGLPGSNAHHLHFEIIKTHEEINASSKVWQKKTPVIDRDSAKIYIQYSQNKDQSGTIIKETGWYWPKTEDVINDNYYDPSNFIKEHSADVTPPVISSISADNITGSSATIIWTTNEPATSQVEYGTTTAYGSSTTKSPTLIPGHSQTISGLQPSTTYHYRVKSADAAGNLAVSEDNVFTTMPITDTTPPVVSTTSPANGATDVPINSSISATFSEVMDASTITTATFTVSGVSGTVAYSGTTATFTPSTNLASSTTYTATITTGAKDLAGNSIVSNYVWSFTTGTVAGSVLTVTKSGTGTGTVTSSPAGINCGATCSSSFNSGTTVTLTATPAAGSTFSGWSGDPDCTDGVVTIDTSKTCTATFNALSFGAVTNFAVGALPFSVAIADLNMDSKPDLAVANASSNNVSILIGTGTGSFGSATNFAVGSAPQSVAIGDLNMDGKPDLAVANLNSNNVSILIGTGTGSFGAATNFAVGSFPVSIAIADLNMDSKPDLAVANDLSNNVSILIGTGTGSFGSATNVAVGAFPHSVAIGDLNMDGKPDLAVANAGSDNVSIQLGTGTGSFGAATYFAVGNYPHSISIGDLNLDGKPDLAVANASSDNVSILINQFAAPSALTITKLGTGSGTVTSSPAGIDCGVDCSEPYNSGTVVTLTATPAIGSVFAAWSGDPDCTDGIITMDTNKTCTATFNLSTVQQFALTVNKQGTGSGTVTSSPAGINCGTDCTEVYNSGTSVTLTATPDAGSVFAGWTGACTGTGNCAITMDAAKTVTATFNLQGTTSGILDLTFGDSGKVITAFGTFFDSAKAIAIQKDGFILVAGESFSNLDLDFALARYDTNGNLDTNFGVGGKVTTNIGGEDSANALAIQAGNKIVLAGRSCILDCDFAIVRYDNQGILDTTFGSGGKVSTNIGFFDNVQAIAIQVDAITKVEKIVVAGYSCNISSICDFALARYNSDGTPDTTFGIGGIVTTDISTFDDSAFALALQTDGMIVVAGDSFCPDNCDFTVVRYDSGGNLDPTFGSGGIVTTDIGGSDSASSLVLQTGGGILVAGSSFNGLDSDFVIVRYDPFGILDPTFGIGGKVITDFGNFDSANAVAIQADGKIVVAGESCPSDCNFALARYDSDGKPDMTFGSGGIVTNDISGPGGTNSINALAIQLDGRIVAAGESCFGGCAFALARYLP